jgi:hypothetical protein
MKQLNFNLIWGAFMVVLFLGMFVLLVFTNYFGGLTFGIRLVLGLVFLVYAFFRGLQIWKQIADRKHS